MIAFQGLVQVMELSREKLPNSGDVVLKKFLGGGQKDRLTRLKSCRLLQE